MPTEMLGYRQRPFMNRLLILPVLLVLAGCASTPKGGLVLDRIGPPPHSTPLNGAVGFLVVFSSLNSAPAVSSALYRDKYSGYAVFSADGKELVKAVANDRGGVLGSPERIELKPGRYRVVASANGYGQVTAPVLIEAEQTTTIHLEGSFWWPQRSGIHESDPVRLPSGQIAGWRAATDSE